MERFQSFEELLSNDFFASCKTDLETKKSDRVLKSTKIEQMIYDDLHGEAPELSDYETRGTKKLKTFDSLVNDVFQSVYGLKQKYLDESELSVLSGIFNRKILDMLMADEKYQAVKSVCEGKELPSIGATEEFSGQLLEHLDRLMDLATGGKGKVNALDKLEEDKTRLEQEIAELSERRETAPEQERKSVEQKLLTAANRLLSKREQSEMYAGLIENGLKKQESAIKGIVSWAVSKSLKQAEVIQNAICAWGSGDGDMQKTQVNTEILKQVARSDKLRYISQFLGRYKEMLTSKRLAGYTYGRGEKYDIEYGNDLSKALASEFSLLASPELAPLFVRKYQSKRIKQYRRLEPEYKGKGDIIVCLDESQSTFGENNAYGMAIAMVLYEICRVNHTSFALVHFARQTKVDVFSKDEHVSTETLLACAETFLGGGTNFNHPLREASALMRDKRFEKPDVVFITDGVCDVSAEALETFQQCKADTGARLTGILLDRGENLEFTLQQFADRVYRTSELMEDKIMESLMEERI